MADSRLVSCNYENGIAILQMDDGDKNVISPAMIKALNKGLDEAEKQKSVVVLTGRENILSAGFDLKTLKKGNKDTFFMLSEGLALTRRLLSFPTPVVIACPGHAVAMGAFLLLSGDYRIGAEGPYRIVTNEVAIGLTIPHTGIEVSRQRLAPAHFVRAALLSEEYDPVLAVRAGFLDQVVQPSELMKAAMKKAVELTKLDMSAHYHTKLRARETLLKSLRSALMTDRKDLMFMGVKKMMGR